MRSLCYPTFVGKLGMCRAGATQRASLALKFKKGKVKHTDRSTDYLLQVCNLVEFNPFI